MTAAAVFAVLEATADAGAKEIQLIEAQGGDSKSGAPFLGRAVR